MLLIDNLRKSYPIKGGKFHSVLNGVNLTVNKGDKVGILGKNGAGKSTLIKLIGGIEMPDSGRIISSMTISWPLGFNGGTQGSLTGMDNIIFLCRVYDVSITKTIRFVEDFAELGHFLREPVKTYSAGMRGRLNFALSMAFDFDCLLIDEGLSAGDERFTEKCKNALNAKLDSSIIFVSHSMQSIKDFCNTGFLLEEGKLVSFDTLEQAIEVYEKR
jgi:capsular polysaccharide transport system ATP-binding protein